MREFHLFLFISENEKAAYLAPLVRIHDSPFNPRVPRIVKTVTVIGIALQRSRDGKCLNFLQFKKERSPRQSRNLRADLVERLPGGDVQRLHVGSSERVVRNEVLWNGNEAEE